MSATTSFRLVLALALFLFGTLSHADTTLTLKDSEGKRKSIIQIKGNMARISNPEKPYYTLYDKRLNTLIRVNDARHRYTEINREALKQQFRNLAQMRQQMMAQMKAQLAALPPQQRHEIEQQMGQTKHKAEKIRAVAAGNKKVKGIRCRMHELYQGKNRIAGVCLATPDDAGMEKTDFTTLMAMLDFMREMAQQAEAAAGRSANNDPLIMSGLKGIPLIIRDNRNDDELVLGNLSAATLDSAVFTGYRNYEKQTLAHDLE